MAKFYAEFNIKTIRDFFKIYCPIYFLINRIKNLIDPFNCYIVSNSEMSNFCSAQGRTRVCGEAYVCAPQPETRGERRAGQKGPFMNGY